MFVLPENIVEYVGDDGTHASTVDLYGRVIRGNATVDVSDDGSVARLTDAEGNTTVYRRVEPTAPDE